MNRSIWKVPRIIFNLPLSSKDERRGSRDNRIPNVYSRNAVIAPKDIGTLVKIHNGHYFVSKRIAENWVGYKFGAFANTRKRGSHKRKKKKK